MEYNINLGLFNGVFAVPNSVVDESVKIANGDNLKVLLYCLRHAGQTVSVGELSRATGVNQNNVASSLEFWEQRGLFGLQTAPDNVPDNSQISAAENNKNDIAAKKSMLQRDYEFSPKEISAAIENNEEMQYLFDRVEELYGRPTKPNEQKALAVITEDVGMKPEVTLMLVEFCFSIGKTTPSYMKKVASSWIEQEINTLPAAEEEIKRLKQYCGVEAELKRLLNVQNIPDSRKPLVNKWLYDYKFSVDIIYEAYQLTIEKTEGAKLSYKYMDKILTDWHENGLYNQKSKPNFASRNKQEDSPSFDLDELNRQIMSKYKVRPFH